MNLKRLFGGGEEEALREHQKEIEELYAARNSFFSNLSHEIRTPINTIIGMNEMNLREDVSDEVRENSLCIESAGKMLLHLVNDILDMSKIESGQMKLLPAEYQTGRMLSDIVNMFWKTAKDKNLEFSVAVADDLPSALIGDEVRIKQILINILNNAVKYTDSGSVTLSIRARRDGEGNAVMSYTVSDTGIGIKKENLPYLFTAFSRMDEEKTKNIEGTGLGLSIVKSLVDMMGGKITVNSVYTKGTTFVIEIPQRVADDAYLGEVDLEMRSRNIHRSDYHQSFEAPDANVLIVDDTPENMLAAEKLLRATKVNVFCAANGREALAMTLEKHFHVIFMDHFMPDMDGIECARKIRNQTGGFCRDSKIVALTVNAGNEAAALYMREGFDGYIEKPVTGIRLERELRRNLPHDLLKITGSSDEILEDSMSWIKDHEKKSMTVVTTESVADLPDALIAKFGILVIPHMVRTPDGVFRDGNEIDQNGVLSYMADENAVVLTEVPDVEMHEVFFADALKHADNVVHISVSGKVAHSGYHAAMEASKAFDNVTVVDSGHLSSGQGLLVLSACKMALEGAGPSEIAENLEKMRDHINTGFIVDGLEYMARNRQVSYRVAAITRAFMIRPVLVLKKGIIGVGGVFLGSRETAWKRYINSTLKNPESIDRTILLVTYVGLNQNDIEKIRKMVEKRMKFEEIFFQKASPSVAVNCGPGTFGLLFARKD
ncbi:MAG: DegV family EDD domain-containing protein [Lachnospiraceae bacterium]|nr:DegV family EDD domain-containing protein [Lachnospiraceae bacterium]